MMLTALAAATTHDISAFTQAMELVARGFEALGAVVLIVGVLWAMVLAWMAWRSSRQLAHCYTVLRQAFGGTVLLGLEILVAADLIRTVAVAPTLDNVLVLGVIVLIRTFLSFSLETEIEGVVPWRRAVASGAGAVQRATVAASGARQPDAR